MASPPEPRPGPDTFTNHFTPEVGQAAVQVLEHAGYQADLPGETLCCALTWISTGQLTTAKQVLRRTVDRLPLGGGGPRERGVGWAGTVLSGGAAA